jgi:hypothetical protein
MPVPVIYIPVLVIYMPFPVEETIPRGAYVDPDELRELRGKVGLRSLIPSKVDIERPEFEAEAYRVFLFRELVMRENLRVTTVQVPLDCHIIS